MEIFDRNMWSFSTIWKGKEYIVEYEYKGILSINVLSLELKLVSLSL
jgi:hypothetical protein